MWSLGSRDINVTVSIFEGQIKVHVRKYRKNDMGVLCPTTKGVALDIQEWEQLKFLFSQIDATVANLQPTLQMPVYATAEPTHMYSPK